ncbi:MAG: hypothetical protein HFG22_16540 [Lachnospiraceae bacterium]|nr:hypothetical protein [Lachnospiraceae bacterium]
MTTALKEKAQKAAMVALPAVFSAGMALTSFAVEEGSDASAGVIESAASALVSSVTSITASIASAIGSIIPIALPLVGVGLVVTIGLNVFKKVSSKA